MNALGATGVVLPFLGFGVSGALSSPLVSSQQASKLIEEARKLGISVFDTAPFYGEGLAETRLSAGLQTSISNENLPPPFIITKGGTHRVGRKIWKDFSIDGLRKQLIDSHTRLPHIDAFFLHGPAQEDLTPELFKGLSELKAEGLFKFAGVAGRGNELDTAISSNAFDLIMAPLHKQLPPNDLERIETARMKNIGIIGIEALAPAARGIRLSLKPSDLWYSARAIKQNKSFSIPKYTADDCLKWIVQSGLADIVLSTTTKQENLAANVASCTYELEILSR